MSGRRRVLSVVASLVVLVGCGAPDESGEAPRRRELGQEIVVTGSVDRRIDAAGFVIESDADAGGLLVISPSPEGQVGDVVEVHGLVQRFERREVEAGLGRGLDEARYTRFEGQDFIQADRVVVRS